jgi:hypothetical protein
MEKDEEFLQEMDVIVQKYKSLGFIRIIGLLEFSKQAIINDTVNRALN